MKTISWLFTILLLAYLPTNAQTLMSVDGEDIDVSEFKRMYAKASQNAPYTKESVNKYFSLFKSYKLKLAEAKAKGIDKDPKVLREIAIYEDQIIQNEFDKQMMNDLLSEVENRLKEEICASHILLPMRKHPEQDEVDFVHKKALELRTQLLNGADWKYMVEKKSGDIDTKYSEGNLGCFTALQLSSYQLENEIYALNKGELSMPIRTKKGYHIVKIDDRRPSNGMVKATQLFVRSNNTQSQELNFEAERRIKEAYYLLQQGGDFDEVGAEFLNIEDSELQVSKDNIDWFTVGSYEASFENAIFSLEKEEFSQPVKTSLGWHIFRLDDKKPLPKFESIKQNVRDAILEDERYFKAKIDYTNKIKHTYEYEKNEDNVNDFIKEVAIGIGIKRWQTPTLFDYSKEFFKIGNKVYTAQNFVDYVKDQHSLDRFYSFDYYYNTFESNKLLDYHKQHMVEENPSFQLLLDEYRDGIILFNLMEDDKWTKQTVSSPEVKQFYEDRKQDYLKEDNVVTTVYSVPLSDTRMVKKMKEFTEANKNPFLLKMIQKKIKNLPSKEMILPLSKATINGIHLENKNTKVGREKDGSYELIISNGTIKGDPKPYSDVKNQVLIDYQQEAEKDWVTQMEKKYPVTVNTRVLEQLYK